MLGVLTSAVSLDDISVMFEYALTPRHGREREGEREKEEEEEGPVTSALERYYAAPKKWTAGADKDAFSVSK